MDTPLTIKEYAACHGLSETTVRRRIRAGGLDARLEHGRYFIFGQNGVHAGDEANTQSEHVDTRIDQANDRADSQVPRDDSPEHNDRQAVINRLTSEVDYLRGQLDKQTQLLALSTAQNGDMVKKLNPPPQPSLVARVSRMVNRLRKNTPHAQAEGKTS